jgi:hypothetical protein
MSLNRRTLLSLGSSAAFGAMLPGPTAAQATQCGGINMLDELKASDPALFDEVRKAAAATINARKVLWKIEQPDKPDRAASHLFGTIHLTDDRVQALPPRVKEAMLIARRIAIEVDDLNPRRINEAMKSILPQVTLADGGRLEKLLTAKELQRARQSLARSTLPPDILARVRPWVANVMLATTDCERSRILGGKLPMDQEIAFQAENRGIGTMGLETVELQMQALASMPDADQLAILKAQLSIQDRANDMTETLVQLYLARDLGAIWPLQVALAKKAGVDAKSFESYRDTLLTLRNKRMRDRAHIHLLRGGIFIAVGALHLVGPTGMVKLFEEFGYKLTAVE